MQEKPKYINRIVASPEKISEIVQTLNQIHEDDISETYDSEIEKTHKDISIIHIAQNAANEFWYEKNEIEKKYEIPISGIHILPKGGTEKVTHGKRGIGAAFLESGTMVVDKRESDVIFAVSLFHEMSHLKSYMAIQATEKNKKITDSTLEYYRSGFSITSRDGQTTYFYDIEEAIIGYATKWFYTTYLKNNHLFEKGDLKDFEKNPDTTREEETSDFLKFVDDLYLKNQDMFSNREEIISLFIKAQVTGNVLPVARLIEYSYGTGAFRYLGNQTASREE